MDFEIKAVARHVPMSAQKVRLVIDQVRGMNADAALDQLSFMPAICGQSGLQSGPLGDCQCGGELGYCARRSLYRRNLRG